MARFKATKHKIYVKTHSKVHRLCTVLLPYLTFISTLAILYKVYNVSTYVDLILTKVYNVIN